MAEQAGAAAAGDDPFAEKRFYLDEFHEKTLFFALAPEERGEAGLEGLLRIARELLREDARVVVMVEDVEIARRLEQRFRRAAAASLSQPLFPAAAEDKRRRSIVVDVDGPIPEERELPILLRLWSLLRAGPIAVLRMPRSSWVEMAGAAVRLATRLKVHKLVLLDPEGGVGPGRPMSFLDESVLETLLAEGEAEWAGLGHRRPLIDAIREGLLGGIPSINLCTLDGLDRELYTYEGSGTLFTLEDYCRVDRVGIDDFREVESLLERGQREGFLKIRSREEIGQILFTGFGATIGSGHLAGVGSLLVDPYRDLATAEIVALYTISRFAGEGVGARLLERLLAEARKRRLTSVFACTTEERAAQFFLRHGFRSVEPADVPPAKWLGYEEERKARILIFKRELSLDASAVA